MLIDGNGVTLTATTASSSPQYTHTHKQQQQQQYDQQTVRMAIIVKLYDKSCWLRWKQPKAVKEKKSVSALLANDFN